MSDSSKLVNDDTLDTLSASSILSSATIDRPVGVVTSLSLGSDTSEEISSASSSELVVMSISLSASVAFLTASAISFFSFCSSELVIMLVREASSALSSLIFGLFWLVAFLTMGTGESSGSSMFSSSVSSILGVVLLVFSRFDLLAENNIVRTGFLSEDAGEGSSASLPVISVVVLKRL